MKIKVTIDLTAENFEILANGSIGDFDDPCQLLADLQYDIQHGQFEVVE